MTEEKSINSTELLRTVMYVQEALLNVLEEKKIMTRAELIEELKKQHLKHGEFGKQQ